MCHLHTCTTYRATYSCTDRHSHTCHTCHTAADIFGALARGYVVCVAGRGEIKSDLGGCLTSLAVTHVCSTPALWRSVCLCAWEEGREGREGREGGREGSQRDKRQEAESQHAASTCCGSKQVLRLVARLPSGQVKSVALGQHRDIGRVWASACTCAWRAGIFGSTHLATVALLIWCFALQTRTYGTCTYAGANRGSKCGRLAGCGAGGRGDGDRHCTAVGSSGNVSSTMKRTSSCFACDCAFNCSPQC